VEDIETRYGGELKTH